MWTLWRMAYRNLLRNPRRSLATGLSISVGVAGVLLAFGFILHVERYLQVAQIYLLHTGHLALYKPGGLDKHLVQPERYSFTSEEQERIRQVVGRLPGVERIAFYLEGAGLVSNGCKAFPYRAVGIDLETESWLHAHSRVRRNTPELAEFQAGRGLWTWHDRDDAIGMSAGLAVRLQKPGVYDERSAEDAAPRVIDCQAADARVQVAADANVQLVAHTFTGSFTAMDGEIVNRFTTGFTEFEDSTIFLPLPRMQALYDTDTATWAAVFLKDGDRAGKAARQLEAELERSGVAAEVRLWKDPQLAPRYVGLVQFLSVVGLFVLVVMALVVGLSVVNAVTISLIERRRELGTLRALGFTPARITRILAIEVGVLSVASTALGLGLGTVLSVVISHLNIRFEPPGLAGRIQLVVEPTLALCFLTAAAIGAVAVAVTLWTARRHLRWKIVSLLQAS